MHTIRKAEKEDATLIHHLGNAVYHTTYDAILSSEQIAFMLRKNYTPEALQASMDAGQDFFLISDEQHHAVIGFIALQEKCNAILRIEKLYLLKQCQGSGYGKVLLDFAVEQALERGLPTVELNVNRGNKAYHFYLKQGFKVVQEVDIPYFGFVLDDYVMRKEILNALV